VAILDKLILLLFIVAFGSTPFLVVNWFRYMKRLYDNRKHTQEFSQFCGFPYKSVFVFVAPIIAVFALSSIMTNTVRSDVLQFLSGVGDDVVMRIEDEIVSDPRPIIAELRRVTTYLAHHSHPEKTIHLVIESKGATLSINLRRDSDRPQEYWVFYPHYKHTSMNEIGRITSSVFDSYK
jgi:hypothetical protein